MRTRGPILVLAGLLAAAGACGADDDGDAADTGRDGDAADTDRADGAADEVVSEDEAELVGAVYEGELGDGSTLVIRLDVPADDPAVAPFDEFRAITGAESPTWIVGDITVPAGVDGTGRFVTFLASGADRLEDDPADRTDGVTNADFACSMLEDWFQAAEVKDEALSDAYMEVYEGPCDGQGHQVLAPGGETTTYVLAYSGELPDFETMEAELGNPLTET